MSQIFQKVRKVLGLKLPESATAVGHHRSIDVHRKSTPIEKLAIAKIGQSKSLEKKKNSLAEICQLGVTTIDNKNYQELFRIRGCIEEARYP